MNVVWHKIIGDTGYPHNDMEVIVKDVNGAEIKACFISEYGRFFTRCWPVDMVKVTEWRPDNNT